MNKLSQKNVQPQEPWQIHPLKLIEDNHLRLVMNFKTAQIRINLLFNALSKFLSLQSILSIVSRTLNKLNTVFIVTVLDEQFGTQMLSSTCFHILKISSFTC